ncbi:hypothetical protein H4J51_00235 [Colwellia sp. MB02u-18]|uniref:hypothetical protein n=1 Tax=Alteromonadales TaxID=135622 RepID=UPI0015F5AD60|nr:MULTISPECIES: hypothetical protein [unclassified Colwellia]MBA6265934.1 hypothetical protein [Colwellia sp. MB3u-43]MBA6319637.1 hypothetical protein [Colwellia sp. MB02u-19]MBA6323003.1 hypothetical protein [Colwellia sp. MB02u-18]MBA6329592.1 hypothetical protein [Colwellia sp. MB02u-12]MBA6343320.1 hypothetical protein [Colwellia sp. MB02u-1]
MDIIFKFTILGFLIFFAGFLLFQTYIKEIKKIDIENIGWWKFNMILRGSALVLFFSMLLSVAGLTMVVFFGKPLVESYF